MQGAAQRDEVWTKYVNTLEDLLTESKESVALIMSNQDTPMKEMQEERKHMKSLMAQNTNAWL